MARAKTGIIIICKECGEKKYLPACKLKGVYKPTFCSKPCAAKHRIGEQNTNWKGGDAERQCQTCNQTFFVKNKVISKGGGKYCTHECYLKANAEQRKATMIASLIEKKCRVCDKVSLVRPCRVEKYGVYCSALCRNKDMGLRRSGENSPSYKHGLAVKHRLHKYYNEIRKRAAAIKNHSKKEWISLKKAYNYTCPCYGIAEPEIKLEKDHILPISKGGHSGIDNIQPLCRICNLDKNTAEVRFPNKFSIDEI